MIKPMLLKNCKDKDLKKYEGDYIAQEKFDGTRLIVIKNGDSVILQTRSGKNNLVLEYPEIVRDIISLPYENVILDGELVFVNNITGCVEFLTGLAQGAREGLSPHLIIFDFLEWGGVDFREQGQMDRTGIVNRIFTEFPQKNVSVIETRFKNFEDFYLEVVSRGGEGIVLKWKHSVYQEGKRSSHWLKIKKEDSADCFVIGLTIGEGKFENLFGALILGQYDSGGNIIHVCNCSGMSDAQRMSIYDEVILQDFDGSVFPSSVGEMGHILHKCAPRMVVEISFMERLPSGSMRFPRFVRVRTDKEPKECGVGKC